jgi:hypothetical protein
MTAVFYLLTLCLPLATVLVVFAMRYYAMIEQAKARLANDDAYRQTAEKAAAAESECATALTAIQSAIEDARTRLTAIEKILKEVE